MSIPVVPRPAASVMVVRPRSAGYEVFMVRRHQKSKFAPDVFVFPGGTVRPDDHLGEAEARDLGLDPAALHRILADHEDPFAEHDDGGLSLWVAALRELFEEAGLLLAEEQAGLLLDLSEPARAERFRRLRTELQEGRLSLGALARTEGLQLAADRLVYFSRWITPPRSPRRFDTRFLLAELPAGQTAEHCQIETVDGLWIDPREALGRYDRDEFPLMFVTREHVKRLAEFSEIADLLDFSRSKPVVAVQTRVGPYGETIIAPEQRQW